MCVRSGWCSCCHSSTSSRVCAASGNPSDCLPGSAAVAAESGSAETRPRKRSTSRGVSAWITASVCNSRSKALPILSISSARARLSSPRSRSKEVCSETENGWPGWVSCANCRTISRTRLAADEELETSLMVASHAMAEIDGDRLVHAIFPRVRHVKAHGKSPHLTLPMTSRMFDKHRVSVGHYGARFIAEVRNWLQRPHHSFVRSSPDSPCATAPPRFPCARCSDPPGKAPRPASAG